jgi:CRP/FNR family transcriptional regulator, cyclic AMP receptor protein
MESLERILSQHPFLRDLDAEEIRFLVSCAANRRFEAGTLLLHEGDPADAFFLVRSGRVSLEAQVPGRGPFQLESVGGGDVLGWSWLFPPYRWQLDARAVEPVVALVFDGRCLREKMELDHRLGFAITKLLLHQLYERLMRVRLQRMDLYRAER